MKLKVCGLTLSDNIENVQGLKVDFTGFIFYKKSSRNIELTDDIVRTINNLTVNKVGVFVDEALNEIVRLKTLLGLDYIQLHGTESVEFCKDLQVFSKVIKVFKVDDDFDFRVCESF